MTPAQEAALQRLNDRWDIASWEEQANPKGTGPTLVCEDVDGDEISVSPTGAAVWTTGAYAGEDPLA